MNTDGDLATLRRLLGAPEMSWLIDRVRGRILDADGEQLSGVVQLNAPSPGQRAAAVELVGRSRRASTTLRVDLADVEAVLRRGPWPAGLADAVIALTGPVSDRAGDRAREADAWARAEAGLIEACERFPALTAWWRPWCATGGLKRAARFEAARVGSSAGPTAAARLVGQLAAVLDALPETGVPISVFARRVVGDAHGLDHTRSLGRLAAAAVGVAFGAGTESSRRDAWASAGVVLSNVSSTVLALGVDGASDPAGSRLGGATAAALAAMRSARAPTILTLDQVRSKGVAPLPADGVVHICENPTVVEVVASRWETFGNRAASTPVLVCTSGQPSTAVVELVQRLMMNGAECRYHGDFDWAGLRIARALSAHVAWSPWRFTTADYLAATAHDTSSLRLRGTPVEAPWDPDLGPAMTRADLAVEEEFVADLLASDLVTTP